MRTRGHDSKEVFFASGDMYNLAYIGAKKLNFWLILLPDFVYFETKINEIQYWSNIWIFGANILANYA